MITLNEQQQEKLLSKILNFSEPYYESSILTVDCSMGSKGSLRMYYMPYSSVFVEFNGVRLDDETSEQIVKLRNKMKQQESDKNEKTQTEILLSILEN